MVLWQFSQIAQLLSIQSNYQAEITGVSIDTRTLKPGDLYVAIKGEQFDGADFIPKAFENGASAAITHKLHKDVPQEKQLLVADSLAALTKMGKARRDAIKGQVIAITGSVGKTSVKDAIFTLLSTQGKTHSTLGNFNNHIGLPLTLARMPADTQFAVLEMGMNHAGEIEHLTKIGTPDISVITTVDTAHIENLGSREAIADAKSEIFLGQKKGGVTVLPIDNPLFERVKAHAEKQGLKIITFGKSAEADFRFIKTEANDSGQLVSAETMGKKIEFQLGLVGEHQAVNMLAVLAAVTANGVKQEVVIKHMAEILPASQRGQQVECNIGGVKVTVLNDSYNASPASMKAAFAVLAEKSASEHKRSIAVLGDMRELGDFAKGFHEELADVLVEKSIAGVLACGEHMQHLYAKLPPKMRLGFAENALALKPLIEGAVKPNDILLIKGSHGSNMYKLADALL